LTAVAPALLAAVFGPQYRAAAGPLVVLLIAGVLIGVSGLAGTVLIAEGAVRPLLVQVAASLAANLALALALVPMLGAWGAAIATGYPLRVISDTPGFLAIIPQLASAPLTHVSPFLASNSVENPHATPYTQLVALVWDRLAAHGADGRPMPDPVGLSHLLGVA